MSISPGIHNAYSTADCKRTSCPGRTGQARSFYGAREQWIYCIAFPHATKVGVTCQPSKRLEDLRTTYHNRAIVYARTWSLGTTRRGSAYQQEQRLHVWLHRYAALKRAGGTGYYKEWYAASVDDVITAISSWFSLHDETALLGLS